VGFSSREMYINIWKITKALYWCLIKRVSKNLLHKKTRSNHHAWNIRLTFWIHIKVNDFVRCVGWNNIHVPKFEYIVILWARSAAQETSRKTLFTAENIVHSLTNSFRFLQIPPSEQGLCLLSICNCCCSSKDLQWLVYAVGMLKNTDAVSLNWI